MARPYVALAFAAALPSTCSRTPLPDPPELEPASRATESPRRTEFFELVQSRRSVRSFTAESVAEDDLQQILKAANRAPSAGNLQAYEIVAVTEPERRRRLSHAAFDQTAIADAPVVLVFVAHPARSAGRYGERGERLYALQDATIAASYAQLAVHALGLGSVWVGAFYDRGVLDTIEAKKGFVPSSLLAIGHAAESPPPTSRRDLGDLVHRERLRTTSP